MSFKPLIIKDQVAILTLDQEGDKVNTLNESMMSEFTAFLDQLEQDDQLIGLVLISGKKNNFIAGADIEMFRARDTAEEIEALSRGGHEIFDRIEAFPKPIVAAIHGSCLGGGFELSLACHYRVASGHSKTTMSLPEVKLGLLPGTGGTQRLPRLIGIQKALTYMLTGKNIFARQAKRIGLVDELTHKDALETAGIAAVHRLSGTSAFKRKDPRSFMEKVLEGNPLGRSIIFSQALKRALAQTRGNYPAPPKIIESVKYGYKHGFKKGLLNESRLFGELGATPESRALVNLFFSMTNAKKNPFQDQVAEVQNIGILGAGLMGSGIADVSINKGNYRVLLKDRDLESAAKGEKTVWKALDEKRQKRIITSFERDQIISRLTGVADYDDFHTTDVVIEAVFEDLDLKRKIVQEVESVTDEHCIFASNTSSLPIKDIAKGAARPQNIIGMHYFSPVQKMPLLEIITTDQTADWVTATAYDIGVKQGKTVIAVHDGPGFYTTRILAPYMNEALLLLEEGASIEFLDKAMKDFGFPVGPMALFDEVGMDVGAHVSDTMTPMFEARGQFKSCTKAQELVDAGYLGRKNGKGMFIYGEGKKKQINPSVYDFFGGASRTNPDKETAQRRIAFMMINEAAWCLQDGILRNPTDGDLGAILGLGFPPFTGGPFRYMDHMGLSAVTERMNELSDQFGKRFEPAPIIKEYASSGKKFFS